ncbi:hypothetical protein [Sphingomonas immobilis]|uniref:Uncharacterized protein n=1 Tax=Sphingomonas immobilis TaxID=3063997 RepID=A0ABT8ZUG8_9SPHN|nr:hypothetical protein [Sphingomonas sp. CA1-15]MDO7840857.1 hypothetical protein [Sphingomonas sp. CA1-15]
MPALPPPAPPPTIAAPAAIEWPDTPVARLQALAMLQALELALVTQDSATLVLDDWCAKHHLAPPGSKVIAERQPGAEKPAPADVRASLHVGADEPIRHRLVALRCGGHTLSIADNWYVPSRLTPEMNRQLDSSDISFGRIVRPLDFRRTTLSSQILWKPLPDDWDSTAPSPRDTRAKLAIPPRVIENRAVLVLPDGTPFSHVVENYTGEVLAVAPPAR